MKFCFVILHYLNLTDTILCISSILENIEYKEYFIVVVDNASPDGSGKKLERLYVSNRYVTVLHNSENLGYAKGNNAGAAYAVKNFNPDFICVINNDTEIKQNNFIGLIVARYNKDPFHILGPDIISRTGSQNPYRETMIDLVSAKTGIKQTRQLLFLNAVNLDKLLLKYVEIKRKLKTKKKVIDPKEEMVNVGLHGACIVFSKDYFNNYPGLFYPKTFLFMEENILSYIRTRDGLKAVYFPEVKIYHKEDGSMDTVYKRKSVKRRMIYKLRIDSIKKFIELIKHPELFSPYNEQTTTY